MIHLNIIYHHVDLLKWAIKNETFTDIFRLNLTQLHLICVSFSSDVAACFHEFQCKRDFINEFIQ